MTAVDAPARDRRSRGHRAPGPGPGVLVSRALPALVVVVAAIAVLQRFGTPPLLAAAYLGALLLLVTLPGTLLWRACRWRTDSWLEDLAVGSALGLAAQVLLAFALGPLRSVGWVASGWAALVVLLCLHPRLRRVWTRRAVRPWRTAHLWWVAGSVSAAFLWVGSTSFARNTLNLADGSGLGVRAVPATGYIDMPYHLSLAAGVRSFWPLVFPYLYDEPLHYHFFVYEHLAAMSATTGIDLTWVLYRLSVLPLVALAVVLVAVLAVAASRRAATGPVAAVLATTLSAFSPWAFAPEGALSPGVISFTTFRSPTQTFGICLFLAAAVVAIRALQERRRPRLDRWPVLAVLLVLLLAAGGSKSTLLPILVCAFGLVALVGLLGRRPHWRLALGLAVASTAAFAVVALLVIGTSGERVAVEPLATLRSVPLSRSVIATPSTALVALLLCCVLAAWLASLVAIVPLRRRPGLTDPALVLLCGAVIAGVAGTLLTRANGGSQLYFLFGAWPALVVVVAWGLVEGSRRTGIRPLLPVVAGIAGVALAWMTHRLGTAAPETVPGGARAALPLLFGDWMRFGLAAVVVVGVLTAIARRNLRASGTMLVIVVLLAATVAGAASTTRVRELATAVDELRGPVMWQPEGLTTAPDLASAALTVRDRSAVSDVVATNAHCWGPVEACEARRFSVSALTERRVLVEGWAYPDGQDPDREWSLTNPFWDEQRYAENEVVFTAPTRENLDHLRDAYGVRWLLVDRTVAQESPELARLATLVAESPGAAVYRIG